MKIHRSSTFPKMKFTSVFIATTTTLLTIANAAYVTEAITEKTAPSLATCPKKEEFSTCEAEKIILIDACTAGVADPPPNWDGSNATKAEGIALLPASTLACYCEAQETFFKECGPMCPEVFNEVDLNGVRPFCLGIDFTPGSGSRVAVSQSVGINNFIVLWAILYHHNN
jgi:hypothetical protein